MSFALPNGRYERSSLAMLSLLGEYTGSRERFTLRIGDDVGSVYLLKPRDIPLAVATGKIGLGLAPEEWCLELYEDRGPNAVMTLDVVIPISQSRLSFIAADVHHWPPKNGIEVATPFPRTAARILETFGVTDFAIWTLHGSIEGVVSTIVPLGFDCVETGATLRRCGLFEVFTAVNTVGLRLISAKGERNRFQQSVMSRFPQIANKQFKGCG